MRRWSPPSVWFCTLSATLSTNRRWKSCKFSNGRELINNERFIFFESKSKNDWIFKVDSKKITQSISISYHKKNNIKKAVLPLL